MVSTILTNYISFLWTFSICQHSLRSTNFQRHGHSVPVVTTCWSKRNTTEDYSYWRHSFLFLNLHTDGNSVAPLSLWHNQQSEHGNPFYFHSLFIHEQLLVISKCKLLSWLLSNKYFIIIIRYRWIICTENLSQMHNKYLMNICFLLHYHWN